MSDVEYKDRYFGSFGQKQPFGGEYVQPIYASCRGHAEAAMKAQYSGKWCMVYTEDELRDSIMFGHKWLPSIEVTDYGTDGHENLGFDIVGDNVLC